MKLPTYFNDFLKEIRLTENQIDDLKTGHTTLSNRLSNYDNLKDIIVSMFLQGSYKRSTAIRPTQGKRSDVDLVVVTNLDSENYNPEEAMDLFIPFMDKYYKDKYRKQTRSIGIELSYVDLDVVITTAPSEMETDYINSDFMQSDDEIEMFEEDENADVSDWKTEPLLIPDRDKNEWDATDPLEQIRKTIEKNKECNGHYVNVVKALKWWKLKNYENNNPPKSYPLEHFIWINCPDGIESVAEGVVTTLEGIVNNYSEKPLLPDHGVPEHNVFERVTDEQYNNFYKLVKDAAVIARQAYDSEDKEESVKKWQELFGSKFPAPPKKQNNNINFSERTEKSNYRNERYAK